MRGDYNPALKPKKSKKDKEKEKKVQERWAENNNYKFNLSIVQRCRTLNSTLLSFYSFTTRLFEWRPEKMRGERSKHERTVIIKNLFTPELFDKEVHLILEYQNDLREECQKCGTVRKVIIYDVSSFGFMLLAELKIPRISTQNDIKMFIVCSDTWKELHKSIWAIRRKPIW